MLQATKLLIHRTLLPLLSLLLVTACNVIIPNQQDPNNTNETSQTRETNENPQPQETNAPMNQNQNQNSQQNVKSQTQDGFTITVTNVTTMGNNVKIHLSMNNQGTDKVLTQLGVSQVEQNGQIYEVLDPYKQEYLKYPMGSRDSLEPGESGEGHVVFALPDPNKPFTFKVKPYSLSSNPNIDTFYFYLNQ
jgi:hypothetical protein